MKIVVSKAEDRDTMVVILERNGYTVRQVKERKPGDKTYSYFVEVVDHGKKNE